MEASRTLRVDREKGTDDDVGLWDAARRRPRHTLHRQQARRLGDLAVGEAETQDAKSDKRAEGQTPILSVQSDGSDVDSREAQRATSRSVDIAIEERRQGQMPRSDSFLTRVTTILHQTSSYQTETDRKA